jgi:hypothetical protein
MAIELRLNKYINFKCHYKGNLLLQPFMPVSTKVLYTYRQLNNNFDQILIILNR